MKTKKCALCSGTGKVSDVVRPLLEESVEVRCPACNGLGVFQTPDEDGGKAGT